MPDPSTDPRAVLLGTTAPPELAGVRNAAAGGVWMGSLPDLEAKQKLDRYATALCAHMVPPSGGGLVGWLWDQRIARVTQAALLLVHIAQGNEAQLEPEVQAEAIRTLWPVAA
jgi:hypothetical protein